MADAVWKALTGITAGEQMRIAVRVAVLVGRYGELAPAVIDPTEFRGLVSVVASREPDPSAVADVRFACLSVIERFDEEPPDNAFFAFGAVVALFYATEALLTDAEAGVLHAAARLQDVAGFAENDGLDGAYDLASRWLIDRSDADERELSELFTSDARRRQLESA